MAAASERRHGPELELGIVARQLLLGRKADALAALHVVAHLPEVDPLRRGQDDADVTLRRRQHECLRDHRRVQAKRVRLVGGPLRVRVREQLVRDSGLVESVGQVRHRRPEGSPIRQRYASARACDQHGTRDRLSFAAVPAHSKTEGMNMAETVQRVDYLYLSVPDAAGEGDRVLSALRDGQVNLLSYLGFPAGDGRSQLDLVAEDAESLRTALEQTGMTPSETKHALLVQGDDRVGAVVE